MSTDLLRKDIDNTLVRLRKQLDKEVSDLSQINIECATLAQMLRDYIPEAKEDLGSTQNPVLIYDAHVTLEFEPDGRQVLRVAIADAIEPDLINSAGDRVFEGDEWQHFVDLANKWMEIDYLIKTYEED